MGEVLTADITLTLVDGSKYSFTVKYTGEVKEVITMTNRPVWVVGRKEPDLNVTEEAVFMITGLVK